MKAFLAAAVIVLFGAAVCNAQSKPTEPCRFPYDGWATPPEQRLVIAEVTAQHATLLTECQSQGECVASYSYAPGTPVLIYRQSGGWTCGYFSGRKGAGPNWIRSDQLRVLSYNPRPSLKEWLGIWIGGEDRVSIHAAKTLGALRLEGNAEWHGAGDNAHIGAMEGTVVPDGNRLHLVSGVCTVDMTLLGNYIVASDNMNCGGLNARFEGIWKRVKP